MLLRLSVSAFLYFFYSVTVMGKDLHRIKINVALKVFMNYFSSFFLEHSQRYLIFWDVSYAVLYLFMC